jgi:hypothetical protein
MGKSWCAALPVVDIAQGTHPKPLTLVLPYYENAVFLQERQIPQWTNYPEPWRAYLSAILVDDGSTDHPLDAALSAHYPPFPIRSFRIEVDVRWNWLAARNVAMHRAPDGWCLLTDMDHVVPQMTIQRVLFGQHDPAIIYGFSRQEWTGETIAPHPNSWLMTRAMFWKIGGYDETLSGYYGTDGDYRRRCAAAAPIQILTDPLIRYEWVGDSSTTRYLRKQPEDAAVKRIVAARGKHWRPKTLSFPYREIFAWSA